MKYPAAKIVWKKGLYLNKTRSMLKKSVVILIIVFCSIAARSQSADTVYNRYLDFNLARFQGEEDKLMPLAEKIMPDTGLLPAKARINFYFSVGKLYEDHNQPANAAVYYEKVAAAVPGYYVAHRGLGYIYLDEVKAIEKKINAAGHNKKENKQLTEEYIKAIRKTLPHLEKAQACDPSDETLAIIKTLYKNTNDNQGLNTLDNRLKQLSVNCIDVLLDH
jgi:hypothetical protein